MVAIAGCQIAAGLGDTDDRPSRLQFVDAETIVQIAFEIECRHIRIVRIVEPGTRPQPSLAFWPRFRPFSHIYPSRCTIRSEEHTSELQSLMRISYAVFCLKKKINNVLINICSILNYK